MKARNQNDVTRIVNALRSLPTHWDGKAAVLQLKQADYQWRQMEWIGFYFEFLCRTHLKGEGFDVPGEKYGNVEFDSKRSINWDMKSSAIKSHNHKIILNDKNAIDQSIASNGAHGIILALLDVEYNDTNRAFQKWHSQLKGGMSAYERKRIARNATSRYRKTAAKLEQVLLLELHNDNQPDLGIYRQGRNSDGSPRNVKYMLDIENLDCLEVKRVNF